MVDACALLYIKFSMFSALDIGDELDVDLYQLVDTVLDEIEEAKQKQLSGDSDDQIMPTASPSIYVSFQNI